MGSLLPQEMPAMGCVTMSLQTALELTEQYFAGKITWAACNPRGSALAELVPLPISLNGMFARRVAGAFSFTFRRPDGYRFEREETSAGVALNYTCSSFRFALAKFNKLKRKDGRGPLLCTGRVIDATTGRREFTFYFSDISQWRICFSEMPYEGDVGKIGVSFCWTEPSDTHLDLPMTHPCRRLIPEPAALFDDGWTLFAKLFAATEFDILHRDLISAVVEYHVHRGCRVPMEVACNKSVHSFVQDYEDRGFLFPDVDTVVMKITASEHTLGFLLEKLFRFNGSVADIISDQEHFLKFIRLMYTKRDSALKRAIVEHDCRPFRLSFQRKRPSDFLYF